MAEVVGTAILTAAGVEAVSATAASIVGTVAIATATTAISIGVQYALQRKQDSSDPGDGSQAMRSAIMPRLGGYGRMRVAGATMLYEEFSGVSFDAFALISGKIGGFVGYYLHEDEVTLAGGGLVNALADFRYSGFRIQIETRLGLAVETVFAGAHAALPGIWTAAHRGDGVASLALTCNSVPQDRFQTIYPNGLPQPSAVLDLYPVFDPRIGGQDRMNPATWAVSHNPVINLINYLIDPDHGMGLDWDVAIAPRLSELMAEADLCDDSILLGAGGGEARYACSGLFTFDAAPEDVIGPILASCDGWLAELPEGEFALQVGVYRAPVITIEDRHVTDFSVRYGVADEEMVNELTTSFISPLHKYAEVAGDPWRDEASIAETGRVRSRALALKWAQSHSQVRRLAKRASMRLNAPLRGTIQTKLYGLRALGERWIRLKYPRIAGLENAVVEISAARVSIGSARVSFDWILVDPATIDEWSTAEEGTPPPAPGVPILAPMPTPQNVSASIEGDTSQGFHSLVRFDDPARSDFTYRLRYRISDPVGPWVEQATSTAVSDGAGHLTISTAPVPGGVTLEIEIAFVAASGVRSDWSDAVTAGTFAPALDFKHPQNSQYVMMLFA
jgi:hypothetical protein